MENRIEEDIEILEELSKTLKDTEERTLYNLDVKNKCKMRYESLEHILSDYKRVLKENEELLELKVCTSAHNRILKLEKENELLRQQNISYKNNIHELKEVRNK